MGGYTISIKTESGEREEQHHQPVRQITVNSPVFQLDQSRRHRLVMTCKGWQTTIVSQEFIQIYHKGVLNICISSCRVRTGCWHINASLVVFTCREKPMYS